MRYSQNVQRVLKVPSEAVALLATLWLRGPQTAAELRSRASGCIALPTSARSRATWRNWRPDRRARRPLVTLLPRRTGMREQRWAHLLSGQVAEDAGHQPAPAESAGNDDVARLRDEVRRLSRTSPR